DLIKGHLDRATRRARYAVRKVNAEPRNRKRLRSLETASLVFEAVHKEFEAGMFAAFHEFERASRNKRLGRGALLDEIEGCLQGFMFTLRDVAEPNLGRLNAGTRRSVDELMAKFDSDLQNALSSHRIDFFAPLESEGPTAMASKPPP